MLKAHYRRFLAAAPGRLHFAAHSHHLWPDVTRDVVLEAWDDAARLAARKWEEAILARVVPEAQGHVAQWTATMPRDLARQGHLLAFRVGDASALAGDLRRADVEVDHRGDLIRFGPYREPADVDELLERLSSTR